MGDSANKQLTNKTWSKRDKLIEQGLKILLGRVMNDTFFVMQIMLLNVLIHSLILKPVKIKNIRFMFIQNNEVKN